MAFGILFILLIENRRTSFRTLSFPAIAPILAYVLWRTWLNHTWNSSSVDIAIISTNIGTPLVGLSRFVQSIFPVTGHSQCVWLIELLFAATFMMVVMWVFCQSTALCFIRANSSCMYGLPLATEHNGAGHRLQNRGFSSSNPRHRSHHPVHSIGNRSKVSWLLYLTLMISLTQAVWVADWAFLRALSEFYLLGIMILLESQSSLRKWIFCGCIESWLLLGVDVVNIR